MRAKYLTLPLILAVVLTFNAGCAKNSTGNPVPTPSTLEQRARDGVAAATGFIGKAQEQYKDQCVAAPTGKPCVIIHKAVASQNVAIDALRAYCGFGPVDGLDATCKPVASAADALTAALNNLSGIVNDVKGVIK
jgi:hypothetical protein